jgi:hypothetical protein
VRDSLSARALITLGILKITWDSWQTISTTEPAELVDLHEH